MLTPILYACWDVMKSHDAKKGHTFREPQNLSKHKGTKTMAIPILGSLVLETAATIAAVVLGIMGSLALIPLGVTPSAALLGAGATGVSLLIYYIKKGLANTSLGDNEPFVRIFIPIALLSSAGLIFLFHLQVAMPATYFLIGAGGTGSLSYLSSDIVNPMIKLAFSAKQPRHYDYIYKYGDNTGSE